ncbi:hypothetical protein H2198_001953 [Neophaeococcomyces mojaviensis]|uniref:Uncharacterized protein n=1 Tax=Neophaeococcomyces mojaviensis TaxID=3383035 RepID=A0ACC3AFD8_9EURO|nr:hypothetical protein H2198_001953 [Knufia sp. JES_112]
MIRLVDTGTLALHEVEDSDQPDYTYMILSHRWSGTGEVSYDDLSSSHFDLSTPRFKKLVGFCSPARSHGYRYVWVDTCCINKNSTVDVQQAINSMYRWYKESKVCVAYLEDVGPGRKPFSASEWFERGWTLQELIAPKTVWFYNHDWESIGEKTDLVTVLSNVTGIPAGVLSGDISPQSCSVAQRMSWVAKRKTKRIEDRAYGLVGLFDVSLQSIYGEREKAFRQLQEQIVKRYNDDHSIFAWRMENDEEYSGLFAPSPDSFYNSRYVVAQMGSPEFLHDNRGISLELPTRPFRMETYIAMLSVIDTSQARQCAILLARLPNDQFVRVRAKDESLFRTTFEQADICRSIKIHDDPRGFPKPPAYGYWLRRLSLPGNETAETQMVARDENSRDDRILIPEGEYGTAGVGFFGAPSIRSIYSRWSRIHCVKLGFDDDFNPICRISNAMASNQASLATRPISSHDRRKLCSNKWMTIEGEMPTVSQKWSTGFCLLKGDKSTGIDRTLPDINVHIKIERGPNQSPELHGIGTSEVWMVNIEKIVENARSPESEHCLHHCYLWSMCIPSMLLVFTGCPCFIEQL